MVKGRERGDDPYFSLCTVPECQPQHGPPHVWTPRQWASVIDEKTVKIMRMLIEIKQE